MAKKKDNLKGMKKADLENMLETLQEDLRSIHFKAEGARPKNVKEVVGLKKQIARVMTAMNVK